MHHVKVNLGFPYCLLPLFCPPSALQLPFPPVQVFFPLY